MLVAMVTFVSSLGVAAAGLVSFGAEPLPSAPSALPFCQDAASVLNMAVGQWYALGLSHEHQQVNVICCEQTGC